MLLVDTDPQHSAGDWWRARDGNAPELVECDARLVRDVLQAAAADGVDLVVVDTRPSVEADTADIARLADMTLIPCRAGVLDLRAIRCDGGGRSAPCTRRAAIVLGAVPASRGFGENSLTAEARRACSASTACRSRLPSAIGPSRFGARACPDRREGGRPVRARR